MGRSVAVTVAVAVLLLLVALVAYRALFGDDGTTTVLPRRADAGVTVVAVADAGTNADGGVMIDSRAEITAVRGTVQSRSAGGKWEAVAVGARLDADDGVRTGRNAEAVLRLGDGVEVRMSPRSEFTVRELSDRAAKIRLEEGHVTATVDENGKRVLKVAARGTDAEAESTGGQFGVVADGRGQLAVATTTGQVKLTAAGSTVEVGSGQASTVQAGGAPSTPRAIPSSLFLKLGEQGTKTNQLTTTLTGSTDPGALVRVGDQTVTADSRGKFTMKVPLKDGKNTVAVDVIDASGRARTEKLPEITVDREKPAIEAETQWGTP